MQCDECRDHRYRQGQTGDHGRTPGMQEQEYDQHRQQRTLENRGLDAIERAADEIGIRLHGGDTYIGRQTRLEFADRLLDAVSDRHHVGALNLEHVDPERWLAVDARNRIALRLAIDDIGNLVEMDRQAALLQVDRTTPRGDDDATKIFRVPDPPLDPHQLLALATTDVAGRQIAVGTLDCADHLVDPDAVAAHLLGLEQDLDLADHAPVDRHVAHARYDLQAFGNDLVGQRREFAQRVAGRIDRESDHRLLVFVLLRAADPRHRRITRKRRCDIGNLVAYGLGGFGHIGIDTEFEPHIGRAFTCGRKDTLDTADGIDDILDRAYQFVLDGFGRGPGVGQHDRDHRRRDIRHLLDRQPDVGKHPEQQQRTHDHGGEYRLADAGARYPHGNWLVAAMRISPAATRTSVAPPCRVRARPDPPPAPARLRSARRAPRPGCRWPHACQCAPPGAAPRHFRSP